MSDTRGGIGKEDKHPDCQGQLLHSPRSSWSCSLWEGVRAPAPDLSQHPSVQEGGNGWSSRPFPSQTTQGAKHLLKCCFFFSTKLEVWIINCSLQMKGGNDHSPSRADSFCCSPWSPLLGKTHMEGNTHSPFFGKTLHYHFSIPNGAFLGFHINTWR